MMKGDRLKPELLIASVALALSAIALLRMRNLAENARDLAKRCADLAEEVTTLRKTVSTQTARVTAAAIDQRLPIVVEEEFGADSASSSTNEALERALRGLSSTVQVLEMRAQEHDALLCALVTEDEARHLWNLSKGVAMQYQKLASTEMELRSLVRRKLIAKKGDFKIHELGSTFNLIDHFELTDTGETLLELRKVLEGSDLAPATSLPPPPDY